MNVFREFRKIKKRSITAQVALLCIFLFMFIMSTFAWFKTIKYFDIEGVTGVVSSWDVKYYVNDVYKENTHVFETRDFVPGMDNIVENIKIYNTGELSTNIKYEIISVKLFGEDILDDLHANSEITYGTDRITLFNDSTKYPFKIYYTFDKTKLTQTYVDDISTPRGVANVTACVLWTYDNGTETKDTLDTSWGERAYTYYKENPDGDPALVIEMKITSDMVVPT